MGALAYKAVEFSVAATGFHDGKEEMISGLLAASGMGRGSVCSRAATMDLNWFLPVGL